MTISCSLSSISMSRSNPAALRDVQHPASSRLETVTENGCMEQYMESTARYLSRNYPQDLQIPSATTHNLPCNSGRDGEDMVQGWSEATLTEEVTQSGRYSTWSTEEWEFDRAATERVGRMFHRLNGALYDGHGSGYQRTDRECREWTETFPHFQVQGVHLLDSLEDGTEIAWPVEREDALTQPNENEKEQPDTESGSDGLVIVGRHIDPITLSDTPEEEALKEEVIAIHGVLEEYVAFDNSSETGGHMRRQEVHGVPSAPYHLPPVAPKECVRHTVWSQVMDALWYEVVDLLQPLVLAARDRALKEHSSRQSLQTSLATSHSTSPHAESHLLLPGLSTIQPPFSAAANHLNTQYYHGKPFTSSLAVPAIPQLPRVPALSGVMQIKPVALKHRIPNMMPHSERGEEILSRLLPLKPATPPGVGGGGYRQISSRVAASRRPQQLRPIDNPRTPALEGMEQARIRGYRLATNTSGMMMMSPPPTAGGGVVMGGGSGHVRYNQLPPLDVGGTSAGMQSTILPTVPSEQRSPPMVRGKSTFSQRNASATSTFTELQDFRRLQLSGRPSDPRPNTSSGNFRVESGKPLGGKKLSDPTSRGGGGGGGGGMKIVGYAAGVSHSSSTVGNTGESGSVKGVMPYSIAEDEEEGEGEGNTRLNITGYSSGLLKSKPRSMTSDNRGKHRGHGR